VRLIKQENIQKLAQTSDTDRAQSA